MEQTFNGHQMENASASNPSDNGRPLIGKLRDLEREMDLTLHVGKSPFAGIPESFIIPLLSLLHNRPMGIQDIPVEDWDRLFSCQQLNGIAAILYYKMKDMEDHFLPSEAIINRLRNSLLENRAGIFYAKEQLGGLLQMFKRKAIHPIVIKGLALAYTVYPHGSLRPPGNDIDLLIKPEEFLQAREIMLAQGYHADSYRFEILRDLQCEETFQPPKNSRNIRPVDLHWDLHVASGKRNSETTRGIFKRSVPVKTPDLVFQTMHPVDTLVHSAVHLMQNHYRDMKLLWICDIGFLGNRISKEQSWKMVQERSQEWNALLAVQNALKLAAAWTGLRLPEGYADFSLWPEPGQTERRAILNVEAKGDRPDVMLRLLLETAPGLSGKMRLMKNLVFPKRSYVCGLHPPLKRWLFPVAYLSYWRWWIKKSLKIFKGGHPL